MIKDLLKLASLPQSAIKAGFDRLAVWMQKRFEAHDKAAKENAEREERDNVVHLDLRCEPKDDKCDSRHLH